MMTRAINIAETPGEGREVIQIDYYPDTFGWLFIERQLPPDWEHVNGLSRMMLELEKASAADELDVHDELIMTLSTLRREKRIEQGYFISLREWVDAVQEVEGLRLNTTGTILAKMPDTDEVFSLRASPGSVQALVNDHWIDAFQYLNEYGVAEFQLRHQGEHPVSRMANQLATKLNAVISPDFRTI